MASTQGVTADCRLLQWLLVLKPRGQNRGLCLWLETQRGHQGIRHRLQPRYGRAGSLGTAHGSGLADPLRGLGLQGTGLLRWKQLSLRGGTCKPLNSGLEGKVVGEACSQGPLELKRTWLGNSLWPTVYGCPFSRGLLQCARA